LTQLALDVLFRSIGANMLDAGEIAAATDSLQSCDASESSLVPASHFIDSVYAEPHQTRGGSRAATPMIVRSPPPSPLALTPPCIQLLPCTFPISAASSPNSVRLVSEEQETMRLRQR
jgi:hypothetical protein